MRETFTLVVCNCQPHTAGELVTWDELERAQEAARQLLRKGSTLVLVRDEVDFRAVHGLSPDGNRCWETLLEWRPGEGRNVKQHGLPWAPKRARDMGQG